MRYDQTVHQSSEILRMVLPYFARHRAAYHPVSYALWYEYVAGINPGLKERLDAMLAAGQTLDDDLAYELYREHILDPWSARSLAVNARLESLITRFSGSAQRACADAEEYDLAWITLETQLAEVPEEVWQHFSGDLLGAGLKLRSTVGRMRAELLESIAESERLKGELNNLQHQVMTDPLTGLFNRRGLDSAFSAVLRQALETGGACSVILVDIDHFKRLNDTYGHVFGDQVLKSVASALQRRVRGEDLVARLGGEEFLIVLPNTGVEAALVVAEQMRAFVERADLRKQGSSEPVEKITISVGVTGIRPKDTPADMIARADAAMYRAKNLGRNQVALVS